MSRAAFIAPALEGLVVLVSDRCELHLVKMRVRVFPLFGDPHTGTQGIAQSNTHWCILRAKRSFS